MTPVYIPRKSKRIIKLVNLNPSVASGTTLANEQIINNLLAQDWNLVQVNDLGIAVFDKIEFLPPSLEDKEALEKTYQPPSYADIFKEWLPQVKEVLDEIVKPLRKRIEDLENTVGNLTGVIE